MDEREWEACGDPRTMLNRLLHHVATPFAEAGLPKPGGRKLRLFCIACCVRVQLTEALDWTGDEDVPGMPEPARWAEDWVATTHCCNFSRGEKADLLRSIVGNPFRPVRVAPAEPPNVFSALDVLARELNSGATYVPRTCLTPTVLAVARSAYHDRLMPEGRLDPLALAALADALEEAGCPGEEECPACRGSGVVTVPADGTWGQGDYVEGGCYVERPCPSCEPADNASKLRRSRRDGTGRVPHPVLAHLRGKGPRVRGDWAVDLVLEK